MKLTGNAIFLALALAAISLHADLPDIKREMIEIKQTERGRKFLQDHSEDNLGKVILFLNDPGKYFNQVRMIDDICSYISLYDDCSLKKNENQSVMSIFLSDFFFKINSAKVEMLSFLLLRCEAPVYIEEIADTYTRNFKNKPQKFIAILKKTDWKRIVDRLDAGNWSEFKIGLGKLGKSKFELELKKYVFAPRDENGHRIKSE